MGVIIFTKNINTEGKTCYSKASGEREYLQENTCLILIKLHAFSHELRCVANNFWGHVRFLQTRAQIFGISESQS